MAASIVENFKWKKKQKNSVNKKKWKLFEFEFIFHTYFITDVY